MSDARVPHEPRPRHVVVVADGDVPPRAALDAAWPGWDAGMVEVLAADGGLARARDLGLEPVLLVGDMDSLAPGLLAEAEATGTPGAPCPGGQGRVGHGARPVSRLSGVARPA